MSIDLAAKINSIFKPNFENFENFLDSHLEAIGDVENGLKQIENALFSEQTKPDKSLGERTITVLDETTRAILDERTMAVLSEDDIRRIENFSQLIKIAQSRILQVSQLAKTMESNIQKSHTDILNTKKLIDEKLKGADESINDQFKRLDERLKKEWDPALESLMNYTNALNKTAELWLERVQFVLSAKKFGVIQ